jgi:hypothetical protein
MMVRAEKETAQGGSLRSALEVNQHSELLFFGRIHFGQMPFVHQLRSIPTEGLA